jgi:hypothetical protein
MGKRMITFDDGSGSETIKEAEAMRRRDRIRNLVFLRALKAQGALEAIDRRIKRLVNRRRKLARRVAYYRGKGVIS